jgi:hypothetical protein
MTEGANGFKLPTAYRAESFRPGIEAAFPGNGSKSTGCAGPKVARNAGTSIGRKETGYVSMD